jgi:hypothetical protein
VTAPKRAPGSAIGSAGANGTTADATGRYGRATNGRETGGLGPESHTREFPGTLAHPDAPAAVTEADASARPARASQSRTSATGRPLVSVVVPTLGRPELLERCLDALLAQDLAAHEYEIVVVDDGPAEATRRLVQSRETDEGTVVRYVANERGRGPAAARNLGWHAARAPLIAFTDDDCLPAAGWLRAGIRAFTDGVVGVSGRLVMPLPSTPTDYELDAARLEGAEFVTANAFYRRDALARVGGFDERFTSAWREDSDLYFTLLAHRGRLCHEPRAVVIHPVRPAPWGVSLKQQKKSQFNALLYKKHPELYRERLPQPPQWYYGATFSLPAALALLAAGRPRASAAAAALWLALTANFAGRRLRRTARTPAHVAEMAVTSAAIPPVALFWRLLGALRYRVPFF